MPTQQEEKMINKIIKDWVGEVDVPYFEPEDPLERGRIQGRNNHIVLLQSCIPQLTERIEKEIENNLHDIIWNKDGSLKSHDISYIVSSVMHYFIKK